MVPWLSCVLKLPCTGHFVVLVAALLAFAGYREEDSSPLVGASFIVGALCSALAGFIGMKVATKANVHHQCSPHQSG